MTKSNAEHAINATSKRYIRRLIRNEDWGGICRMLKEQKDDGDKKGPMEIFAFLTSRNNATLPLDLLKQKDNKEAKALFLMLISLGGSEFVASRHSFRANDRYYEGTLLHAACGFDTSIDILSKLLEVGGNKALTKKDECGYNSLLVACRSNASIDIVSKLIEVGGKRIVAARNHGNWNSLHMACRSNASIDIASKLIEVGGKALVMGEDSYGRNPLHIACFGIASTEDEHEDETLLKGALLDLFTQHGRAKLLTQTDKSGLTPLHFFIANEVYHDHDLWDKERREKYHRQMSDNASLLLSKGIQLQVGGEYGIGGLFISDPRQYVQDRIYKNWDNVVLPALKDVMALPHGQNLPILQSVIVNKAPPHIIRATAKRFSKSINTADSYGRYPIDIAVRHGLAWDEGMEELLNGSNVDILERADVSMGLCPFMVAALGRKEHSYDFGSVFHLIKASPKVVQWVGMNLNYGGEEHPKKKQRCV